MLEIPDTSSLSHSTARNDISEKEKLHYRRVFAFTSSPTTNNLLGTGLKSNSPRAHKHRNGHNTEQYRDQEQTFLQEFMNIHTYKNDTETNPETSFLDASKPQCFSKKRKVKKKGTFFLFFKRVFFLVMCFSCCVPLVKRQVDACDEENLHGTESSIYASYNQGVRSSEYGRNVALCYRTQTIIVCISIASVVVLVLLLTICILLSRTNSRGKHNVIPIPMFQIHPLQHPSFNKVETQVRINKPIRRVIHFIHKNLDSKLDYIEWCYPENGDLPLLDSRRVITYRMCCDISSVDAYLATECANEELGYFFCIIDSNRLAVRIHTKTLLDRSNVTLGNTQLLFSCSLHWDSSDDRQPQQGNKIPERSLS